MKLRKREHQGGHQERLGLQSSKLQHNRMDWQSTCNSRYKRNSGAGNKSVRLGRRFN